MGSFLSSPSSKAQARGHGELSQTEGCKRLRMSSASYDDLSPRLIPYLPDEISVQILARVPRAHYLKLKSVSRRWKAAITSSEVFDVRKELKTTEEWLYILAHAEEYRLCWYALDPLSGIWQRLPPMPDFVSNEESKRVSGLRMLNVMGSTIRIADVIRGWLGRRDALDRMPFCGCAIGAADGCLYVLGGFSRSSAMSCVWRYDPILNMWQEVSSMKTARAFCKTSLLNGKLYVVGGVSRGRGGLTPLQSAEVFDPETELWEQMPNMPFSKAQILPTAFLAEMLKPIATGMTSFMGKLCVPQSLYSWPFFVDVGGEIYDPEANSWVDMPAGMGEGWPAKQAGTKLSVVVNGELYALDPSSSLDNSNIKIYDHQDDSWKVVIAKVPLHDFTDTESPYLLAGFLGKLHVIVKDSNSETAVLEADIKTRLSEAPSTSTPSTSSVPTVSVAETDIWKVIATKNFGAAELVSCQVLDI
ncbi:uncharacterized protein A4U43_C07F26390 [Asparagus officinalis]|uniref:F-box domain-containing protein n=1 Tax=Asparagus officinalis TaxID=4686 RepID=A0A5P1EEZ5_ASPOF|nr:F-box/kelch-repeat protein At1g22040 [Asparagus officinalis]XP_020273820.1 F-box/kelch-repeat protein At1g22040 [Asparagus officinalis]XP_020273821.1 F-box/kelch-repeat protein At1g22040 [Asparagus officinalis]ONK64468.1 uncharacterized protein A4U43_C07F26390 [Asparagus officinalis]